MILKFLTFLLQGAEMNTYIIISLSESKDYATYMK
jgi:hypothetical protein